MANRFQIFEQPAAKDLYLLAGWRQWADGGSVSSGLPKYLIQQSNAHKIGEFSPGGYYMFQIPGTHDLLRPVVKFEDGFPVKLKTPRNEFFYTGNQERGAVIFLGDEPHLNMELYVETFLDAAQALGIKRIIGFGGVYGELPYDKERMISSTYSQVHLKAELDQLAVSYSDYHGGASIGAYICHRAAERQQEYISLYAFVPTYDFSQITPGSTGIQIENDFTAWLGVMRRVNHLLNLEFDLSELEHKSQELQQLMNAKIAEIERENPDLNVRDYLQQLSENFTERTFDPAEDFWEEQIGRLFDKLDDEN
ncbi:MAG: PAC2 family protein [Anaerolineales bacterium]|nr:PAC2 family protein [Anaerolineales bacterium]